jgi:DNA ligase-1
MTFKPLLASEVDLEKLVFPVLASPKMDGIRALSINGKLTSRNMKLIPNLHVQQFTFPEYLDGEILTYTDGKRDDFNTVQSKIMSRTGEPDFVFHVFDRFETPDAPFIMRHAEIRERKVSHVLLNDLHDLQDYEEACVSDGWEGVMLRDPQGKYKFGRSTVKEGILLKMKRFDDDEAVITGTVERMHNSNEATKDALGRTERSSAKAGMVPMGTLGALSCTWRGVSFEIGTGFDDATRQSLWNQRSTLPGMLVNFKFQGVGSQGAPRFPVYRGMRHDL